MHREIKTALTDVLTALGYQEVTFVVDRPTDVHTNADLFSNVALTVAGKVGVPPREVAAAIATTLQHQIPAVERIEIAGPGFLNFYLSRSFFIEQTSAAYAAGENWGRHQASLGETVLIEYTSPNLFKPLHIGNLVGNIIGEALTRLFEYGGATVKRLNYPSDIGPAVAKAVWGLQKTGGDPSDIMALGEAYRIGNEAYETNETDRATIMAINEALYADSDMTLSALRTAGITSSQRHLDAICARLGTTFDAVIYESEAGPHGLLLVREHMGKVFQESDGAVVYPGEKVGLHTRVFINQKGLPTYEAKDLGNFSIKQRLFPHWTRSIVVTGNEQTEYFKVLFAAIRDVFTTVGERALEHIPTGFLTLTSGKMSSRKGNVLTGESLLSDMEAAAREKAAHTRATDIDTLTKQVAVAALKYQILRQSVGSNIVFDAERALSFEGDSGPYLQYTHARICSVLDKAAEAGILPSTKLPPPEAYVVEKLLSQFPSVIESSLIDRAPHKVAGYLTELAGAFNSFYVQEKIADASDVYAPYKAAIAQAVAVTLKNGLWILGIKAPERM